MKFGVLVLDYDGTIAVDGVLDPDVRSAIAEARAAGVVVVLATGKILRDLRREAGDLGFVDAIVAENGAVLAFPGSGYSSVLAASPPSAFVDALRQRGIPISVGECVVEAPASAAYEVLSVLREMRLSLVPVFNRDRLMVLPDGVSKATGLRVALFDLRLSSHNAIAIGDAENDHRMLEMCEIGAAVEWGSQALKAAADEVVHGSGPPDVASYIRRLVHSRSLLPSRVGRRRLLLGHDCEGWPMELSFRGRNLLIAGDPKSGKSWVTGLLCEQLAFYRYCVCVIDPEGDYTGLEVLPGVTVLGGDSPPPRSHELLRALRHPDMSVVIDLSRLTHAEKSEYMQSLLPALALVRRRTGLPHRIVVDEAHYFLQGPEAADLLDLELAGYILVTYKVGRLDRRVLDATETILVTLTTDPNEVKTLAALCRVKDREEEWGVTLGQLHLGEAAVLTGGEGAECGLRRFRLAPRLTSHVRHREKYLDVPILRGQAFVFVSSRGSSGQQARSLREFVDVVAATPATELHGHLRRGDFSRWVENVFGDHHLASRLRQLEELYCSGGAGDINHAMVQAICERYDLDLPKRGLLLGASVVS
ncbi:MAG: HAD hydrolase family protein [Acidobacteriia bacterium]|nr:HAD hydrolase family protein [Terriglobia bacterium]